jgi:hypothetical protein
VTHSINGKSVGPFAGRCICGTVWEISGKCTANVHDREIANLASGKLPAVGESATLSIFRIASTLLSEGQMYANLVDAVHLIERMIERGKYTCTAEEAELIWRLRFVTRIQPE